MRLAPAFLIAATAWPFAAVAQSYDSQDWQLVCDNTRTCRAAGYSTPGSDAPVSVLFTREAGVGSPAYLQLQLGVLDPASVHPSSVQVTIARKPAGILRIDAGNHADVPGPVAAALLKAWLAGTPVVFTSGKASWQVSGAGAVAVLQKMDEAQGRTGTPGALVAPGRASEAGVALRMSPPHEDVGTLAAPQADDAELARRMVAAIPSRPECPLLDDAASQAQARLWHLDANRVLVSQPCWAADGNRGDGYWLANLRPPYAPVAVTYSGTAIDASGTLVAHEPARPAVDCGAIAKWAWNGYRYQQVYAAVGGLCRGVKAGGAWELPTQVSDLDAGR